MRAFAIALQFGVLLAVHAGLSFLSCARCIAEAVQRDDSNPRYQFEVGDELVYQLTSRQDPRKESSHDVTPLDPMEWRVFVARKNADDSWRLLIRTDITFLNNAGKVRATRNSLGYCDLQPDGSYALDEQTAVLKRLLPHELFCRLPHGSLESGMGWSYKPSVWGPTYKFAPVSRVGATLKIHGVAATPYNEMHDWETTKQYEFDAERGLVKRIIDEFKSLGVVQDRRTVELTSVVQHDAQWMADFHAEAEAYLAAYSAWSIRLNDAAWVRSVAACEPMFRRARESLAAARGKSGSDILRALYDAHLREHDDHVKWAIEDAGKREAFFAAVPQFATDWQAPQLDGGTFRLSEQRGKIVVLDFWSTSCEYCVLTAPQFKQLAAEYKDKDVVILGVFDRADEDDQEEVRARSLIKNIYDGISHLEGDEIVARYAFSKHGFGYPALLVLDQAGVVQESHVGYAADLPARLRAIVDRLLANPADR